MKYNYLYGPIPSRRLGISLGIDPIPHKTCPLNCIYCECGPTKNFTIERKEYIPTKNLLVEIDHFMHHNQPPDFITFSGSGEPTLYSDLGKVIEYIKISYPSIKVAVITNSIMLSDDVLCTELMLADLVMPSLDAISEDIFRKIDLPMSHIDIHSIPDYLRDFALQFLKKEGKELWIEIFVIQGMNDHDDEIDRFISFFKTIPYTRLQLNRLDRIGTKIDLSSTPMKILHDIKKTFIEAGLKNVEIIAKYHKRNDISSYNTSLEELIRTSLQRRSMSLEDLEIISQSKSENIIKYLDVLHQDKKVIQKIINGKIIYKLLQ